MNPVWSRFPESQNEQEGPGGFRRCEVGALRRALVPPTWSLVPAQLDEWLHTTSRGPAEDQHFLEYLATVHAAFERIHPFRDGNGRVGRLLVNLLLVRHGAPPAILDKRNRTTYLQALARTDEGDPGSLSELLARAVRNNVERFLLPALAGPHRLVPLRSLATEDLSHVALLSAAKRGRLRANRLSDQWYSNRKWVEEYGKSRHQGRQAA
jgi:hypothetical protein